jgi:hypothetical protein
VDSRYPEVTDTTTFRPSLQPATIQWVKRTARGFWNVEHSKTAIYFHCGGLDLYPHESQ